MFNRTLNRTLSRFGVLPAPKPYGRIGGGLTLPILAFLGWKYREPIKRFLSDQYKKLGAMRETYSNPGSNPAA